METGFDIIDLQKEDNEENLYAIGNVLSSLQSKDDENPTGKRDLNDATKANNGDTIEPTTLTKTSGYRVVVQSWPPEVYYRGVDIDYLEKCTKREVIKEFHTVEAAVQCAKDRRARIMEFNLWSIQYYGDNPPPYCSSDGATNQAQHEEVVTIYIEDIGAICASKREAKLADDAARMMPSSYPKKMAKLSKYEIGTAVCKWFGGIQFFGKAIAYDPRAEYYMIRYEDGDMEEMDETEVDDHIVHVLSSSLWFD